MFRKISLTALALASAVALAPNANAALPPATATVSFSGTVASSCSFGTVTNGTLGNVALNMGAYSMGYLATGSANSTGYASGSVPLNCNTSAAITVGDPTNNGSTGTIASSAATTNGTFAKVSNGSTVCYNASNAAYPTKTCTISAGTNPTLTVDMALYFSTTNPTAGSYIYTTTLTATYN